MPLLRLRNLSVEFATQAGTFRAVDGVDLEVGEGEILAIVGESGSGKSVTSLAIMGLLDKRARVTGQVLLGGRDLTRLSEQEMRRVRGNDIAMIFQDPMTSLNPYMRVADQMAEVLTLHKGLSKRDAVTQAVKMLDAVKIPDAKGRIRLYPHEFSGGMRQRVMIAMALANEPDLLIADEPTTALDVTIQAQILDLLLKLKDEFNMAMLLITHDLGLVAKYADRVAVMYAGRVVETCPVTEGFGRSLRICGGAVARFYLGIHTLS